jgi:hypothetical protein
MQTCVFESTILRGSTNSYGFCRPNGKSSRAFAHISSGPDLATAPPHAVFLWLIVAIACLAAVVGLAFVWGRCVQRWKKTQRQVPPHASASSLK